MNECILVVDDDPEIVRAIAILLEKEGYQVLKAYNGMEALEQAGEEAIAGLIRAIAGESAYDTLVVDIGSGRRTALSVMKLCRVIYMPIREDPVSLAKLKELEQYFSQTGNGMLRERIKRLKLPYHGSFGRGDYIDQLLWGELGDYVRQLLRGSSVGG